MIDSMAGSNGGGLMNRLNHKEFRSAEGTTKEALIPLNNNSTVPTGLCSLIESINWLISWRKESSDARHQGWTMILEPCSEIATAKGLLTQQKGGRKETQGNKKRNLHNRTRHQPVCSTLNNSAPDSTNGALHRQEIDTTPQHCSQSAEGTSFINQLPDLITNLSP